MLLPDDMRYFEEGTDESIALKAQVAHHRGKSQNLFFISLLFIFTMFARSEERRVGKECVP